MTFAPQAQGAVAYEPLGSFGPDSSQDSQVGAVDDGTGNVLRAHYGSGVDVFAPDGTLLTRFATGEVVAPVGIAVDPSSHAVYVSDSSTGLVTRWTSDGLPVPTYTRDLTYAGPGAGGGTGEIGTLGAIEVDPRNGDLLVVDASTNRINRYSSAGAFLGGFDGAGAPNGAFHWIFDLAIDAAGDVYVVDATTGQHPMYGGASVAERYGADGAWKQSLEPARRPFSVAFDSRFGKVLVANHPAFEVSQSVDIDIFDDGERVGSFEMAPQYDGAGVWNLDVQDASGRLYAFTAKFSVLRVQPYSAVEYPDMTVDPPSAVTDTSAHVSGTIDPLGDEVVYRFEYSPDGTTWQSTPDQQLSAPGDPVPAGPQAVEADLTGLSSNREYQVRLSVTTASGTFTSDSVPLRTEDAAPGVVTGKALDRTPTTATLHGTVDPFGLQTAYHFEYGTTAAYGSRMPADYDAVVGGRQGALHVTQALTGLQPGTTYHYRLVASSSRGVSEGADRTFATPPVGEPRGYEQVSPVDKGGSEVHALNVQSSPSGDAVAFQWRTAPAGAEAAPQYVRSTALRDPSAWTAFALDPPQPVMPVRGTMNTTVMAVSRDGRKALVISVAKLADGAVEGHSNLYVRDAATGAYTTIASTPDQSFATRGVSFDGGAYVDGTLDWSHLLVSAPNGVVLVPGDPPGALYDWTGGELRLVSIDDSGETLQYLPVAGSSQAFDHGRNYVSEDGTRIFFNGYDESFSPTPVYMRADGTATPISVSERTGEVGTAKPAEFAGASADGRFVYVLAAGLTDESPEFGTSLYEVDVDTRDITLVAPRVSVTESVYAVSARGRTVYFQSDARAAPEDDDDSTSYYAWRGGQLKYIATPDPSRLETAAMEWMTSPSGRYFAFTSNSALTGNRTETTSCDEPGFGDGGVACRVAYRYDADTGELVCASCRPDGEPPTGYTGMAKPLREGIMGGHYFSRAVLDDGTVFFDTPDALSARDANSTRDVYAFDGEQATLISAGTGGGDSKFGDASADGRSVFFTTRSRLVGQDTDTQTDLYVARLGGGMASQDGPAPAPAPCEQGCQAGGQSPQERKPPIETLNGRGDGASDRPVAARFAKLSASVRARLARTGRARITVRVGRAGRVSVRARARLSRGAVTVGRGSTVARRAGLATVTLKLSRPARRALASRGKLTLRLSLTLAGRPSAARARLDLRRPAQARRATAPTTTSGR